MIEATLQTEPQIAPPKADAHRSRTGAPLGIIAAGVALVAACIVLATRLHQQNSVVADLRTQLTQSNSETARTYSELDKAKVQSASLSAQLLTVSGQKSQLQAQLESANAGLAQLRAEFLKARSRLDDEGARSAGLQAQLDRANDAANGMRRDLDHERSETQALRARLATVEAKAEAPRPQPAAVAARPMPLTASFEKSFWDRGFTLHVRNQDTDPLKVTITITGPARPVVRTATLEGGATVEVGNLPAGVRVTVASDGFKALNITAR